MSGSGHQAVPPNADFRVHSNSETATDRLGQLLSDVLCPGITIALNGQLGSGKTHFVRSLCRGLGADPAQVNSPTFVLLQVYPDGRIPVAHFDSYRLADTDEFLAIGADEFLNSDEFLCVVEWADPVRDALPPDRLTIDITQTGCESREFLIRADGPRSTDVLTRLIQRTQTADSDANRHQHANRES